MAFFPNLGVDEEAKPKSLQNPEDESFRSVKEAETDEESIEKQNKWAEEERQTIIGAAIESFALSGVATGIGFHAAPRFGGIKFRHFTVGPAIMPRGPLRERHADVINHLAGQLPAGPAG